eukprot:5967227-Amphidinium_carterae.1
MHLEVHFNVPVPGVPDVGQVGNDLNTPTRSTEEADFVEAGKFAHLLVDKEQRRGHCLGAWMWYHEDSVIIIPDLDELAIGHTMEPFYFFCCKVLD